MDCDALSTILDATLNAALLSLPDAASSGEDMLRLVVDLPGDSRGSHVRAA